MKVAINNDRIDIILSTGGVYSVTKENYVGAYEYMLTHATANEIESIRKWLNTLQRDFDAAVAELRQGLLDIESVPEEDLIAIVEETFADF